MVTKNWFNSALIWSSRLTSRHSTSSTKCSNPKWLITARSCINNGCQLRNRKPAIWVSMTLSSRWTRSWSATLWTRSSLLKVLWPTRGREPTLEAVNKQTSLEAVRTIRMCHLAVLRLTLTLSSSNTTTWLPIYLHPSNQTTRPSVNPTTSSVSSKTKRLTHKKSYVEICPRSTAPWSLNRPTRISQALIMLKLLRESYSSKRLASSLVWRRIRDSATSTTARSFKCRALTSRTHSIRPSQRFPKRSPTRCWFTIRTQEIKSNNGSLNELMQMVRLTKQIPTMKIRLS